MIDIFILKIKKLSLKMIEIILNIDIGFMFLFAATYLFNTFLPWHYRLFGCFGVYYCYKILFENIKELSIVGKTK